MSDTERFNPPVDLRTGQVSAKACGAMILRPMPGGGYIRFDRVEDAIGHPTSRHAERP